MNLRVHSIKKLSKNVNRVVFIDESNTLKKKHESGTLKLAFPDIYNSKNSKAKKKKRTYTIRMSRPKIG